MPALSSDLRDSIGSSIRGSLQSSLHRSDGKHIKQTVASSAKKALLENTEIKFVPAQAGVSNMLHSLKNKYRCLNPGAGTNNNDAKEQVSRPSVLGKVADDGIGVPKVVLCSSEDVVLSWPTPKRVGAGLCNLGNTCFLNSVLQCLTYTAPLTNFLLINHQQNQCRQNGFCMLCELKAISGRSLQATGQAVKPIAILQKLRLIAKHMSWGRQEDAHEFLRYVVDAMQRASLAGYNGLDKRSKETTLVYQVFGGYLRSQVRCLKCRHASDTFDPTLDLSVDLKNANSLERALQKFVQPEILDIENAYKCSRCNQKVQAQKQFTIHRPANVLTIHLKRFDYHRMMGGKVARHIEFPLKLNIRPYMSRKNGEPVFYQLYGVLVHSGFSCNSGHYYCYVKAPNQTWYCMNDSMVSQIGTNSVLSSEAYILFYVRTKNQMRHLVSAPHTATGSAKLSNGCMTPSKFGPLTQLANSSFAAHHKNSPQILKTGERPRIVMHMKSGTALTSNVTKSVAQSKPCLVPYGQKSDEDSGDSDTECPQNKKLQLPAGHIRGEKENIHGDKENKNSTCQLNGFNKLNTKLTFKSASGNKISLTTLESPASFNTTTLESPASFNTTKVVGAVDDRTLMSPPPAKPIGHIQCVTAHRTVPTRKSDSNRSLNATTPNWQISDNDGTQSHASGSGSNTSVNSTTEWKVSSTNSSPSLKRNCESPAGRSIAEKKESSKHSGKQKNTIDFHCENLCVKCRCSSVSCTCSNSLTQSNYSKVDSDKSRKHSRSRSLSIDTEATRESRYDKPKSSERNECSRKHKRSRSPSPNNCHKRRKEERNSSSYYQDSPSNEKRPRRSHSIEEHSRHSHSNKERPRPGHSSKDDYVSYHNGNLKNRDHMHSNSSCDRGSKHSYKDSERIHKNHIFKTHHSRDDSLKGKRYHYSDSDSDQVERRHRKRRHSSSEPNESRKSKSHKKNKKSKHKKHSSTEFEWVEVTKDKINGLSKEKFELGKKNASKDDHKIQKNRSPSKEKLVTTSSLPNGCLNGDQTGSSDFKQKHEHSNGSGDSIPEPLYREQSGNFIRQHENSAFTGAKLHKNSKKKYSNSSVKMWDAELNDGYKRKNENDRNQAGTSGWDGRKESNIGFLLEQHSTSVGFGPSVKSWSGEKSAVNITAEENAKQIKNSWYDEYEEELDAGKKKKVKHKFSFHGSKNNPFQRIQNVTNQVDKYMKNKWKSHT